MFTDLAGSPIKVLFPKGSITHLVKKRMTSITRVEETTTNPYEGVSLAELLKEAGIKSLDIEDSEDPIGWVEKFTLPKGLDGDLHGSLYDELSFFIEEETLPYVEFHGQIVLTDKGVALKGRGKRVTWEEVG